MVYESKGKGGKERRKWVDREYEITAWEWYIKGKGKGRAGKGKRNG